MSTPETLTRELAALDDALAGRPVDPDLADLAELAVLVRDERPVPDPAFARSLDERAERGFPRSETRRMRAFSWPRITLPALGVAASVLLVVVIATSLPGGGSTDDSATSGGAGIAVVRVGGLAIRPLARRVPGSASGKRFLGAPRRPPPSARVPVPPQPGDLNAAGRDRRYVERSAADRGRDAAARHRPRRRGDHQAWPTTSAASSSRPRSRPARAASSSCGCPSGACSAR